MDVSTSKRNVNILILEDNDADFEALRRAFKKVDMEEHLARCETAEEAVDYIQNHNRKNGQNSLPALILLDLNLPGMDGAQFLKMVKDDQVTQSIPVIVFTTSDSEDDIKECYKSGANNYITKPLDMEKLYDIVENIKKYWFQISTLPSSVV